ncbi:hypothetical protein [Flectobacillus roseus]|uniref:hypothetical protein n=1 Tax=Flectobacillus roseus TaxID=502259 RepID=UPI0024B745E6|nr:hypothetical protein [Flectobacillus roseus]MDI9872232.1 hypothetical protein [Flectobacillus roseus]
MAVRKYIYTFNGVPYSLELDLGDPEGTEVINLGEIGDKANVPLSNEKINVDDLWEKNFPVYTKTAFGFSGGSTFTNLDFEALELIDITGKIFTLEITDPNYAFKRKAYDMQWNDKFLAMLLREAYDLDREYKRYVATYGGNSSLANDMRKTLGIVSSVSSVVVPLLAQQAVSTALAGGASVAVASAAGTAVTASFTAVFSTIMPILSFAIVGLSMIEQSYAEEGKKKLEEYITQKRQYIEDAMEALKAKIQSDKSADYSNIYVPVIDEVELQKIIDQIANTPVSSYYSAPSSKIDYWIVLAVVLFLLFLIIRRRQRQ